MVETNPVVKWSVLQIPLYNLNIFYAKFPTKHQISNAVQWGSEIWISLDFEWSKRSWVTNGTDLEWDLKSRSPTI